MPLYFIGFLAMLGAALLLYAGALVTAGITRRAPPLLVNGRAADALQAVHLALIWSCVGVG
jgi:hypothetical protein